MQEMLSLALLMLAVTVIEQTARQLQPGLKLRRRAPLRPFLYGVPAWFFTGSPAFAFVLFLLTWIVRTLTQRITYLFPPNLWSGLAAVLLPYLGVWIPWALFHPGVRPAVLSAAVTIWGRTVPSATVPLAEGSPISQLTAALVLLNAYLFVWGSGTYLTRAVLGIPDEAVDFKPATRALREAGAARDEDELISSGRLIGNLERFLVLTLTLSGQYTAIGFVIAAKSLARFEMARHKAEYFLIGTLSSLGIAMTVGILVQWVLSRVG